MNFLRNLLILSGCLLLTACAVSSKPEEQSFGDVLFGEITGQNDQVLANMKKKLDKLSTRAKGIEQTLDDSRAQLFAIKRELAGYQMSEKERDDLLALVKNLEKQTKDVQTMNIRNEGLIEERKVQIKDSATERKQFESAIKSVEEKMSVAEKQATVIEDGIKKIAAIRARQALES